jgi:pimeloyl-ACP methyl ester carboxylesterase
MLTYTPRQPLCAELQWIKGAQFVALPEAGHSAWWEVPEMFNRSVLTFIRQH